MNRKTEASASVFLCLRGIDIGIGLLFIPRMPSPKRMFRHATVEQIQAAYAAALERVTNGGFTSLSGGGVSSTKAFSAAEDIMFEASYELGIRGIGPKPGPTHTTQNFAV